MIRFCTLFLFISLTAFSQTGKITGKIIDAKTGETLPGATIILEGTTKGASADFDGNFSLNSVPVGKITLVASYISYDSKKITGVEVKENDVTNINVQLSPSSSQDLQEVTVTVELVKENNTALVLQQKNNISVSDGVSAETIKRTPDRNTSDVLKRVSGASIQDNKFAIVRGLNERYNASYLNGAALPSSESDRKAFAFDIFPSNMLDNIVITKTARPDMPAEFAGGIIEINTKSIPEKNFISVSAQGGYNTITTGKDQQYYKGSKSDWIGLDDGMRAMPKVIPEIENYPTLNASKAQLAKDVTTTDWGIYDKKFSPNYAFQLAAGYNIKLKDRDFIGVLASVTYNRTNSFFTANRNFFANANPDPNVPSQLANVYSDKTYATQTLAGGLLNLSCKITPNHSISWKNLYSINSDDRTILREGSANVNDPNPTLQKSNALWFTSNKITSTQLNGDHFIELLKLKITWVGSYSDVKRDIPNLRRNSYSRYTTFLDPMYPNSADTTYKADISSSSVGNGYGGSMFWSTLTENIKSFKADVSRPFKVSEHLKFELKLGGLMQFRERTFIARSFGYTTYGGAPGFGAVTFVDSILYEDQNHIFANQNMGLMAPGYGGFKLTEGTHAQDSYKAASNLKAAYAMVDIKFKQWFRGVFGARVESYRQMLTYPDKLFVVNKKYVTKDTTVLDILPSANLIFSLNDKQNIRVSYSQTLNRPEFRELAPFGFFDFNTQFFTSGNDSLKRAKIYNYDLRYEIYPGAGQLFSVTGFYKDFVNPIEQIALTNPNEISYTNLPKAKCYGAELEYRLVIGSFYKNDSNLIGKILNNLTLFANFAYIKSEVDISNQPNQAGSVIAKTRPLQGQSPYIFNAGLSYIDNVNGFSLSGMVNRIGERIYVVGNSSTQPAIWENGRTVVDLQFSKSFLKNKLEVRFTIRDLLAKTQLQYFYNNRDNDTRFDKKKDDVTSVFQYGTTYALQVSLKF